MQTLPHNAFRYLLHTYKSNLWTKLRDDLEKKKCLCQSCHIICVIHIIIPYLTSLLAQKIVSCRCQHHPSSVLLLSTCNLWIVIDKTERLWWKFHSFSLQLYEQRGVFHILSQWTDCSDYSSTHARARTRRAHREAENGTSFGDSPKRRVLRGLSRIFTPSQLDDFILSIRDHTGGRGARDQTFWQSWLLWLLVKSTFPPSELVPQRAVSFCREYEWFRRISGYQRHPTPNVFVPDPL